MRSTYWLAGLAVLSLCGCFSSVSEGRIGPEGGELRAGGVVLTVPPGALSEPTRLTISDDSTLPPAGTRAVGKAVQLGPAGLVFAQPITLELPVTRAPSVVQVLTAPDGTRNFEKLPTTNLGAAVQARVSHFSIFIPVTEDTDVTSDAGADAGVTSDAGAGDAGAGPFTGDALEDCQTNWRDIKWWSLSLVDAGTPAFLGGEVGLAELPNAWVFTVKGMVFTIDRRTRQLIVARDTQFDTPDGVTPRMSFLRFPTEFVVVSARGNYAEWRLDFDGRFLTYPDGGTVRRLVLEGTRAYSGGLVGAAHGASAIWSWDVIAVAGGTPAPALGFVPRDPAAAPWTLPVPSRSAPNPDAGPSQPNIDTDTNAPLELADGTVLVAVNTNSPPFPNLPTSVRTDVYLLARDGGLTDAGWVPRQSVGNGVSLNRGPDGGAMLVAFENDRVSIWDPSDLIEVAQTPDAGRLWPIFGAINTTPSGRVVSLVHGGTQREWNGANAMPHDVLVLTSSPAKLTPLLDGYVAYTAPAVGGLRDDSFLFAYFDDLSVTLHAARLCLPP